MDGDLGQMLNSILSDPAQMEKLGRMAQSLMGGGGESEPAAESSPAPEDRSGDPGILSALERTFGSRTEPSRSTALLRAMRPYLRPEKQEKLDRAMKIARMVGVARMVLGEGGTSRGV